MRNTLAAFGNQLHEIASTIGIAIKNNMNYIFPPWKYNSYFKRGIPTASRINNYKIFQYGGTKYIDVTLTENTDLAGYFQSCKFYEHCSGLILETFDPNFEIQSPKNKVSLHIRRGDYLDRSNFHTNLAFEYYQKALDYFKGERVTVFSDDIIWCKKNLTGNFDFLEPGTDILDLFYMSRHENNILANSSYSYWAGYLNPNYNKVVIYPSRWYADGTPSKDMCPESWIEL